MTAPRMTFTPAHNSPWRALPDAPDATEKPALEGVSGVENVAKKAVLGNISPADLPRIPDNKKAPAIAEAYTFSATEAPTKAPVADLAAHHRTVNDHEFTC